jgi:hypothetical protein
MQNNVTLDDLRLVVSTSSPHHPIQNFNQVRFSSKMNLVFLTGTLNNLEYKGCYLQDRFVVVRLKQMEALACSAVCS